MIELVKHHRQEIESLCRIHNVKRLDLFGSAAHGVDFDPDSSDIDFFIEFQDMGWQGSFKRYMGMKLALEDLLGRSVDLIEPASINNSYFAEMAAKHCQLFYAA
jgi:uncharacterized protein